MKRHAKLVLIFILALISSNILSAEPGTLPHFNKTYFSDDFTDSEYTFHYWGGRQCTSETHADQNFVNLGTGNKKGYCNVQNDKIKFITQAFDKRGDWDLYDFVDKNGQYEVRANKGGGEIAQGYKSTTTGNPQLSNENDLYNEERKAVIENGQVVQQGWDYRGESYLAENKIVQYHYRFKINDISMLDDGLSKKAYLFQQHTHNNVECQDTDSIEMAPTAGMVLVKKNGAYKLKFTTKTKEHPYYRNNTNIACTNNDGTVCFTSLYEEDFIPEQHLGEWYNVTVEMRIARQNAVIQGCENPEELLQNGTYANYKRCRPSRGYLSLIINGERKKGNASDLPWIKNRKYFRGVATQFNKCPSYPKLGNYALDYNYSKFQFSEDQNKKLEIEFDQFKITNTIPVAEQIITFSK